MGRGRKPKPTSLKLLQGNPGKRRLNREEPEVAAGVPPKPDFLDRFASQQWDYLVSVLAPARMLTKGEQGALLVACDAYSQLRHCEQILRERKSLSYVGTTASGDEIYRPYPEVAQRNQARRQYLSALAELGLTPSARSRVKALPAPRASGIERFLGQAT